MSVANNTVNGWQDSGIKNQIFIIILVKFSVSPYITNHMI